MCTLFAGLAPKTFPLVLSALLHPDKLSGASHNRSFSAVRSPLEGEGGLLPGFIQPLTLLLWWTVCSSAAWGRMENRRMSTMSGGGK